MSYFDLGKMILVHEVSLSFISSNMSRKKQRALAPSTNLCWSQGEGAGGCDSVTR